MSKSTESNKSPSRNNSSRLLQREEEYKRLNEELEAQTAMLVKEAEVMMREQETFLNRVSSPSKSPIRASEDNIVNVVSQDSDLLSIAAGAFEEECSDDDDYISGLSGSKHSFSPALQKPKKSARKSKTFNKTKLTSDQETDNPPQEIACSSAKSRSSTIASSELDQQFGNDVMPDVASEMGTEAQIRFFKAKLRVVQEELDFQTKQCHSATEECKKYKTVIKDCREETEKVKKGFNQQQIKIQKLKATLEEEQKNTEEKSMQLQNVTKELHSLKREQKQSSTAHGATEVRLNRATEEMEKLKLQLQKQKYSGKEISGRDQREIETLRIENKRLERLRSDSLAVMKKQQKLIGILKRQILHIEAAKLLSFTEEEFVKALDCGNK